MKSKKELAVLLSKLKTFENPDVNLEQYQTDSEVASFVAWQINLEKKFENKRVADLGSGNGILGFSASLLSAKIVYLIDSDKNAVKVSEENKKILERFVGQKLNVKIINSEIGDFKEKVDIVMENPPFGVQKRKADKIFLEKAMEISDLIYSFHKTGSDDFIKKICKENNFSAIKIKEFDFLIKKTLKFHKKETYFVKVDLWRIERRELPLT